jgi:hypothetical protein
VKAIEEFRESYPDNELMTNLEILVEIASSSLKVKSSQELLLDKKLLELSEQADLIEEMVEEEYHTREGTLTKQECSSN